MVIINSSPLIHCAKLGKLEFLFQLFDRIIISSGVYEEVIETGMEKGFSDAVLLRDFCNTGQIQKNTPKLEDEKLANYLHRGEYESIMLAKENPDLLIIDDRKGRNVADQLAIPNKTTAGLIYQLLNKKIINYAHFARNLRTYADSGWISPSMLNEFLEAGKKYE